MYYSIFDVISLDDIPHIIEDNSCAKLEIFSIWFNSMKHVLMKKYSIDKIFAKKIT